MSTHASLRGRRLATEILTELGLNDGILRPSSQIIKRALEHAGLQCVELPWGDSLLAQALGVLDRAAEAIWVRQDLPANRRNYLVAHELGHWWLHPQEPVFTDTSTFDEARHSQSISRVVGYSNVQRAEIEASAFAAELLLPEKALAKAWRNGATPTSIAYTVGLMADVVSRQLVFHLLDCVDAASGLFPSDAGVALDLHQEEAAATDADCALVIAGPGTGKTAALTARVLHLLRQGVPPEHILVLTFGRNAADELRSRLQCADEMRGPRVRVFTAHALGLELLRVYGSRLGLPADVEVITPRRALLLLEARLTSLGLDRLLYLPNPTKPLAEVLGLVSCWKSAGRTSADLENISGADESFREAVRVFKAYEDVLAQMHGVDFVDLISEAVHLLSKHPDARRDFLSHTRHVLVDEVQDLEPMACRLLSLFHDYGAHLWMVGDPAQSIYAFRGASWSRTARTGLTDRADHVFHLPCNYRSESAVSLALHEFARRTQLRDGPVFTSAAGGPGWSHLVYAVADDEDAQWEGIAGMVRLCEDTGIPLGSQAVLCRTNSDAFRAAQGLRSRGIPVRTAETVIGHPAVRQALALLRAVAEGRNMPIQPMGIPLDRKTGSSLLLFLAETYFGPERLAEAVATDEVGREALAWLYWFVVEGVYGLADDGITDPQSQALLLLRELRRVVALGEDRVLPDPGVMKAPAVHVLTIHASKGLEFDAVYVPFLNYRHFPPVPRPGLVTIPSDSDLSRPEVRLEDEMRVMYVAMSRARKVVVVATCGKNSDASPFADDVKAALLAAGGREEHWTSTTRKDPSASEQWVPEHGASHALEDLQLYLLCPQRYWLKIDRCPGDSGADAYDVYCQALRHGLAAIRSCSGPTDYRLSVGWGAWQELWLDAQVSTVASSIYEDAARSVLSYAASCDAIVNSRPATLAARLEGGTVTVPVDDLRRDAQGIAAEVYEFSHVPSTYFPPDTAVLVDIACRQTWPREPVIVVFRCLLKQETRLHRISERARAAVTNRYNRVLQGIERREFSPRPGEACASCPYLFHCRRYHHE